MIECKNLSYKVNGKSILDSVTLTAKDGEITVLLGKNGSGKTTLVRAITAPGEHRSHIDGDITVSDEDALAITPRALSAHISLLPQTLPMPRFSVRELVTLAVLSDSSPFSRPAEEQKRIVGDAIDSVGLTPLADAPLSELSGGERQLAYIAMMMAKGTQNLVLDEPTAALDAVNRGEVFSFLRKMRNEGRAILAVLQDINEAVAIADRIAVLDKGSIIFDGTPKEFGESEIPKLCFGLIPCEVRRGGEILTAYFSKK